MTERSTVTTSPYTIGVAPFRPGDEPSFGGTFTEQPGDLNRPDPATCTTDDTVEHARGLIRVLDDNGEASGEWDPNLDAETLIQGLEYMMRLRIFDDRMIKMQRTGNSLSTCAPSVRKPSPSLKPWRLKNKIGSSPPTANPVPNSCVAETWSA